MIWIIVHWKAEMKTQAHFILDSSFDLKLHPKHTNRGVCSVSAADLHELLCFFPVEKQQYEVRAILIKTVALHCNPSIKNISLFHPFKLKNHTHKKGLH